MLYHEPCLNYNRPVGTDQINSLVPPVASSSTYPRMRRGWRARTSLAAPPAPCRASLRGRGRRRGCAAASQGRTGGWGTGRRPGARCCSHPAGTGAPRGHAGRHASERGLPRQIRGPAVRRRGRTSLVMSLMSLVQKKIARLPACQPQGECLVSAGRLTHLPLTIAWLTLFPQTSIRLRIPCSLPRAFPPPLFSRPHSFLHTHFLIVAVVPLTWSH